MLAFAVAAAAIALLARLVGSATEQLGGRVGSSAAGVVQSALGNLPELFISLFALHQGLVGVVQAALVGSVIANGVLVLGIAFLVGGLTNGTADVRLAARPDDRDARGARGRRSSRCRRSRTRSTRRGAARADAELDLRRRADRALLRHAAVVPRRRRRPESEPPRWSLAADGRRARRGRRSPPRSTSDWFVAALTPATQALHMSQDFAGLVIVAIAGNAVENVVGVQLAARNRPDFAISVIINSALQVALLLTPGARVREPRLRDDADARLPDRCSRSRCCSRPAIGALVVYDGESTWEEGAILIGLYVVIAASFWWGA